MLNLRADMKSVCAMVGNLHIILRLVMNGISDFQQCSWGFFCFVFYTTRILLFHTLSYMYNSELAKMCMWFYGEKNSQRLDCLHHLLCKIFLFTWFTLYMVVDINMSRTKVLDKIMASSCKLLPPFSSNFQGPSKI